MVDFLQQSSNDFYISNLDIDYIWPIRKNVISKVNIRYLEPMYGGVATEILYKPFNNYAASIEFNRVRRELSIKVSSFKNIK